VQTYKVKLANGGMMMINSSLHFSSFGRYLHGVYGPLVKDYMLADDEDVKAWESIDRDWEGCYQEDLERHNAL